MPEVRRILLSASLSVVVVMVFAPAALGQQSFCTTSASTSASLSVTKCVDFASPTPTSSASPSASPTADATPIATGTTTPTATVTASPTATATTLPGTGGPVNVSELLGITAAALLAAGGLFSFALFRRS